MNNLWVISIVLGQIILLKFIYSEKATKFCKIFTLLLSSVAPVKSKVKILQNFEAFSEYMNFKNGEKYKSKQTITCHGFGLIEENMELSHIH